MDEIQDSWKALADPHRRCILELLIKEALTATEIAEKLQLTAGNVSQHLNVLKKGNLVTSKTVGLYRIYALEPVNLEIMLDWLVGVTPSRSQANIQIRKKTASLKE